MIIFDNDRLIQISLKNSMYSFNLVQLEVFVCKAAGYLQTLLMHVVVQNKRLLNVVYAAIVIFGFAMNHSMCSIMCLNNSIYSGDVKQRRDNTSKPGAKFLFNCSYACEFMPLLYFTFLTSKLGDNRSCFCRH